MLGEDGCWRKTRRQKLYDDGWTGEASLLRVVWEQGVHQPDHFRLNRLTSFTEFNAEGSGPVVLHALSRLSLEKNIFLAPLKHQHDLSPLIGHEFRVRDQSAAMGEVRHLCRGDLVFPGNCTRNSGFQAPKPAILLGVHLITMIETTMTVNTPFYKLNSSCRVMLMGNRDLRHQEQ